MITLDSILRVLNTQLIPICVALIGLFSSPFSRMFVRERVLFQRHRVFTTYVLTGQAVLVSPLSGLVAVVTHWGIGKKLEATHVFALGAYLVIYMILLAYYLQMGPDDFDCRGPIIRYGYRLIPILITLSVGVSKILTNTP